MKRALPLLALALVLAALAGCGGGDDPANGRPATVDENDDRALALDCMTRVKGLDARLDGEDAIQVDDPETGPRIRFFLTSGEAESAQFTGQAEGTEQMGGALLYVREASDETLEDVEFCLDHT